MRKNVNRGGGKHLNLKHFNKSLKNFSLLVKELPLSDFIFCFRSFRHSLRGRPCRRLSAVCIAILWLYLFLPFRPLGFPVLFGQVEEWFFSSFLLSLVCLFLFISVFRQRHLSFRFTVSDGLIVLYAVYFLFCFDACLMRQDHILTLYTLTLLYFVVRITSLYHLRLVLPVLVVSVLFQVIHAFYHHDGSRSYLPSITGIFHNTGIWGGFVGVVFVGIFGWALFSGRNRFFPLLLSLFSLALLVYSQSRAAWIGSFGGVLFLTLFYLWKKYGTRMMAPAIAAILLSAPVIFLAAGKLYELKPVSAAGRIYIWKISSKMFWTHPLFGIGVDRFRADYMHHQADYLTRNPDSPFSQIADETTEPFSEPLKIAIEQGAAGLAIVLSMIAAALVPAFKRKQSLLKLESVRRKEKALHEERAFFTYAALLITLLLFSCFSYPLTYIQFNFLLFTCLAVLSRFRKGYRLTVRNGIGRIFLFLSFAFLACYVSITGIIYIVNSKKLHRQIVSFNSSAPESALTAFTSMEPVLKANPLFLTSYAGILFFNNEHGRAIEKLTASQSYHASFYSYMELGRNYEGLGDTESALYCWQWASSMIPGRFEPLYLQIAAYHRSGQYQKADSLSAVFLLKERKVDNIRIDLMMRDVRRWMKERKIEN